MQWPFLLALPIKRNFNKYFIALVVSRAVDRGNPVYKQDSIVSVRKKRNLGIELNKFYRF